MNFWIYIIAPSAAFGIALGLCEKHKLSPLLSAALPFLGFVAYLLYQVYSTSYHHPIYGDEIHPTYLVSIIIGLVMGGTVAALSGALSFLLTRSIFRK